MVTRSPTLLIGGGFWTGEAEWSFRESHARRGNRRQMVAAAARDRARALRAFLRIVRGPRRPFWQALHDDRGSTLIRREREEATLARRRGATLGGASWGASMRFHPSPE
jgi:hypothetical protein